MSSFIKLSEAVSLAFHSLPLIVVNKQNKLMSTGEISSILNASEAHLSKVFQRLSRAGIIKATRGPGGGVEMARPASEIVLLDIYEALEGRSESGDCLGCRSQCSFNRCIFGNKLPEINRSIGEYLKNTSLSELVAEIEFTDQSLLTESAGCGNKLRGAS